MTIEDETGEGVSCTHIVISSLLSSLSMLQFVPMSTNWVFLTASDVVPDILHTEAQAVKNTAQELGHLEV